MQTLYFFSGFDSQTGFPPEIVQSLHEHITDTKSLVLICSHPDTHEKMDKYSRGTVEWFKKIGIEFEATHFLDNRKTAAECQELTKNASAIFLMGGPPHTQLEFLQKYNLISIIQQFNGVVMGMSAGALTMAANVFYRADKDFGMSHIYKGLGLADIPSEPHFSIDEKELLNNEILPFSHIIDIYAMCDGSGILVRGGKKQFFGEIYLVSKGTVTKCKPTDCLK